MNSQPEILSDISPKSNVFSDVGSCAVAVNISVLCAPYPDKLGSVSVIVCQIQHNIALPVAVNVVKGNALKSVVRSRNSLGIFNLIKNNVTRVIVVEGSAIVPDSHQNIRALPIACYNSISENKSRCAPVVSRFHVIRVIV